MAGSMHIPSIDTAEVCHDWRRNRLVTACDIQWKPQDGLSKSEPRVSGKADCRQTSVASRLPEESVGHGQTNLGVPPRAISPLARSSGLVVCPSSHEPGTHVGSGRSPGLKERGEWRIQTKMLKHLKVNIK